MAKCPVCGRPLKWETLIEQMLILPNFRELLKDRETFLKTLEDFVFKCPECKEEFYGRTLPRGEAEKVFELLNDFKEGIDYERKVVRLKLTNLLALEVMLEEWDRRVKRRAP
ncbi:hypothetical protein [Pyrococcus yayanosii]|uniref:Uncharacterized protein n=1 Tax=Pyrococcus yayanosii (strain CH1 / JCM 16557) TaxID=529709 RepID=F8AI30_PYRYC|nr:hypothetical protein [Pyrococcus yayanosii]AEH25498.1 hypothetical protein PYCH_18430 [Pyrococcus yayanosii CH1]